MSGRATPQFWPWPAHSWWAIWVERTDGTGHWLGPQRLTEDQADNWIADVIVAYSPWAMTARRFHWVEGTWVEE